MNCEQSGAERNPLLNERSQRYTKYRFFCSPSFSSWLRTPRLLDIQLIEITCSRVSHQVLLVVSRELQGAPNNYEVFRVLRKAEYLTFLLDLSTLVKQTFASRYDKARFGNCIRETKHKIVYVKCKRRRCKVTSYVNTGPAVSRPLRYCSPTRNAPANHSAPRVRFTSTSISIVTLAPNVLHLSFKIGNTMCIFKQNLGDQSRHYLGNSKRTFLIFVTGNVGLTNFAP